MIKTIWLIFKNKDISIRLYIIAILAFLIGIIFIKYGNFNIFTMMLYLSMGLFEIGFVIWIYWFSKKYIKIKYIKFFWIFFHLAVLWLASVYASIIVSQGLGLPSSDFNYTVSFLTFFCYLPAFLFIATGLGLIVYFISMIVYVIVSISGRRKLLENFSIFHIVGGVITLGFFAFGHDKIMSFYLHNSQKYVQEISYQTDYQYVPKYLESFSKIDKVTKIKLHANGVYSTLKKKENGYELFVGKIE